MKFCLCCFRNYQWFNFRNICSAPLFHSPTSFILDILTQETGALRSGICESASSGSTSMVFYPGFCLYLKYKWESVPPKEPSRYFRPKGLSFPPT